MEEQQQPRGRPTRRQVLWVGAAVALSTIAILIGYRYDITLWDWLKLLVVPAVIAGGGLWFNRQQRERELEIASQQREQELENAELRSQEEALQAYLDQMSDMLIPNKEQPSLYKARPGDGLSSVARARTLTVVSRLDGARKARVVQFLYESGLLAKGHPVLDLSGADLSEAILSAADVSEPFRKAPLIAANLVEAELSLVSLSRATLTGAYLMGTNLAGADLRGADLAVADLRGADLRGAYLIGAKLIGAKLIGADLREADLSEVNLRGADLRGADLRGAYKTDVLIEELIPNEELAQRVSALEGAIMPNGQKYEDWLKSRGSEEDGGE